MVDIDFTVFIDWFVQLWSVLDTPVVTAYGLSLSVADFAIGGLITGFIITLFWKGASA